MDIYYTIEVLIPPGNSITGKEFWYTIEDFKMRDLEGAQKIFESMKLKKRKVRLVKNTKEVIG